MCALFCRMGLTEYFNNGGHGDIHPLLGGSWSPESTAYANRTNAIVQPFVHEAKVSLRYRGVVVLLAVVVSVLLWLLLLVVVVVGGVSGGVGDCVVVGVVGFHVGGCGGVGDVGVCCGVEVLVLLA